MHILLVLGIKLCMNSVGSGGQITCYLFLLQVLGKLGITLLSEALEGGDLSSCPGDLTDSSFLSQPRSNI